VQYYLRKKAWWLSDINVPKVQKPWLDSDNTTETFPTCNGSVCKNQKKKNQKNNNKDLLTS